MVSAASERLHVEGAAQPLEGQMLLPFSCVQPDFFAVTGTRLLAGRSFEPGETSEHDVVIITQEMARALWPGGAVGGRLRGSARSASAWRSAPATPMSAA